MSNIKKIIILSLIIFSVALSAFAETKWEWICSDNKYSQFFAPETLEKDTVIKTITVWTKTTYSYEGAEKTIKAYGKEGLITDPSRLSFSMSRVKMDTQERKILYLDKIFYDANGKVLWRKQQNNNWKEITPYCYNEKIFYGIMDYIFHRQDFKMVNDKDRWIPVAYSEKNGNSTGIWTDKLSIINFDNYATAYKRSTTRDSDNNVIREIEFKVKYNFSNNSITFTRMSVWEINKGWFITNHEIKDNPSAIVPGSQGEYEYTTIRDFIKNNNDFVNRYSKL